MPRRAWAAPIQGAEQRAAHHLTRPSQVVVRAGTSLKPPGSKPARALPPRPPVQAEAAGGRGSRRNFAVSDLVSTTTTSAPKVCRCLTAALSWAWPSAWCPLRRGEACVLACTRTPMHTSACGTWRTLPQSCLGRTATTSLRIPVPRQSCIDRRAGCALLAAAGRRCPRPMRACTNRRKI
jgi:hypothetical protein